MLEACRWLAHGWSMAPDSLARAARAGPWRAQASPAGWPRLPGRADIAHWRRRGVTAHTRYAHLSVSVFFKRPARIARLRGSAALTARRHLSNVLSACLFGRRTALTLTPRRSTFCSALSRPTSLRASGLQSQSMHRHTGEPARPAPASPMLGGEHRKNRELTLAWAPLGPTACPLHARAHPWLLAARP